MITSVKWIEKIVLRYRQPNPCVVHWEQIGRGGAGSLRPFSALIDYQMYLSEDAESLWSRLLWDM